MHFLSVSHLCVRMAYTPPCAIKEKKEDEEGVGIFFEIREEGRLEKLKVKKKQGGKSRGFFSFHFLSKGNRERTL